MELGDGSVWKPWLFMAFHRYMTVANVGLCVETKLKFFNECSMGAQRLWYRSSLYRSLLDSVRWTAGFSSTLTGGQSSCYWLLRLLIWSKCNLKYKNYFPKIKNRILFPNFQRFRFRVTIISENLYFSLKNTFIFLCNVRILKCLLSTISPY